MSRMGAPLGYVVALFDVMGFESRLKKYGLDEIHQRYLKIVDFVNRNSERNHIISELLNIDSPIATLDGPPAVLYDVKAAYASDSILIWANLAWKKVQGLSLEILEKNASHPAYGYMSFPIPLRGFFEVCAEIICIGIECDFPLRGAVSMGDAILDENERIFLGAPLVETARLENKQNSIGLCLANSFEMQADANPCFVPYTKHIKPEINENLKYRLAFNWPDYWRATRTSKIEDIITRMGKENDNHPYYAYTLEFIKHTSNPL